MSGKVLIDSALRAAVNVQSSKLPSEVAKASTALLSSLAGTTHTLPDLPYDYNALERKLSLFISVFPIDVETDVEKRH